MIDMKTFRELAEKKESHGIYPGRFQPLTKAHTTIIEKMSKENKSCTIFLVKGKTTSKNKDQNPFDEKTQINMINKILPTNTKVKVIPTGFFVDELNDMPYNNYVVYAGSDRKSQYERFKSYLDEDKTITISTIQRTDEDISATKVRDALRNNHIDVFKNMVDKRLHYMYDYLRKIITN